MVADRLARGAPPSVATSMRAPMRAEHVDVPEAGRVEAARPRARSRAGRDDAATTKNAADDGSPGTSSSNGFGSGPAAGTRRVRSSTRSTATPSAPQHPLGVVPARCGLHDLGAPVGLQPGEQHRRLHLAAAPPASSWRGPSSAPPRIDSGASVPPVAPVDGARPGCAAARRPVAIGRARSDASPVSTVRNGRPATRPAEHAHASCPSSRSRRLPRVRAGRRRRCPRPTQSLAAGAACTAHAELPRAPRTVRATSSPGARPTQPRLAVGERGEQQRPVRDALVAGHPQPAPQRAGPGERELAGGPPRSREHAPRAVVAARAERVLERVGAGAPRSRARAHRRRPPSSGRSRRRRC